MFSLWAPGFLLPFPRNPLFMSDGWCAWKLWDMKTVKRSRADWPAWVAMHVRIFPTRTCRFSPNWSQSSLLLINLLTCYSLLKLGEIMEFKNRKYNSHQDWAKFFPFPLSWIRTAKTPIKLHPSLQFTRWVLV